MPKAPDTISNNQCPRPLDLIFAGMEVSPMTVAPSHPPVHSYDPGKDPMELVATANGPMERWRADALLLGETSAAVQARHDAVTTLDDLEQQKRELAAGQAALAIERATFDAEKRAFADQAAALAGRLSVEYPQHVPPGELKKIERLDEYGKVRCVEFVGQESFVKQMTRPGRRVVKFLSPSDSFGRAVREMA